MKLVIPVMAVLMAAGCSTQSDEGSANPSVTPDQVSSFTANVWADNWFSLSVNGLQVAEDSVPITTERSFNSESFSFSTQRPFVLALVAKDFKANGSGLEYIGTPRQQMGDGGVIMQVFDAINNPVAVTNESWKCLVTHHAPLNKSCAQERSPIAGEGACGFETVPEPDGWKTIDFDASAWPDATVHSAREVRPKDGYDQINWDVSARLIWGPDLETDNTLLCRLIVQ